MRILTNLLLSVLVSALWATTAAAGDTGTYELTSYRVDLDLRENGRAVILYQQTWKVLGGEIPWVTVGMANDDHDFVPGTLGGAGRKAKEAGGSFVRIDLDRSYRRGESFRVEFAVEQRGLLWPADDEVRLDFIPGWYDRARIRKLVVTLRAFRDLDPKMRTSPEPTSREPGVATWEFGSVSRGAKRRIEAWIPREFFPGEIEMGRKGGGARSVLIVVLLIFLGVCLIIAVTMAIRGVRGTGYGGGSIGTGGLTSGHLRTGHHACVCACACVACACACACAGGGAAGCDRKQEATCPLCRECTNEECVLAAG